MLTYHSWILSGYPEDPLDPAVWDADTSLTLERSLNKLQALIRAHKKRPIQAFLQYIRTTLSLTSPYQRCRYWFLSGRAHIICRKWDEALEDFDKCDRSGMEMSDLAKIHLLRSWAYAAQEAHQHDVAFMKYEHLADLVDLMIKQGREDFIQQDVYCFLCNIYRNQAYALLWVCAPEAARKILEQEAVPLLDRYQAPFEMPARNKDESNWRELHVFVLWVLGITIIWQARLSDDPRKLDQDLYDGDEYILSAAKLSQVFPEGKEWTAELYCFAAEMCIMRCEFANNRGLQTMLCDLAEEHLQRAQRLRHDDLATVEGRLRALTLNFSRYELEVRKHMIFDTFDRMDDVINGIIALREKTERVQDASYRLLTARCLLLLGTIELELQKFAARGDVKHARRAMAYYQQGLDFLVRRPNATLDGLYQRELQVRMKQAKGWLKKERGSA